MLKYVLNRIMMMIPVLLGVAFIIFSLMYFIPGDPARIVLGEVASEEAVESLREEMGLNEPFLIQFANYVKKMIFEFDFGTSYVTKRGVAIEILERFPITVKLSVASAIIAVVIGISIGIISAVRQYSIFDNIATAIGLIGVSMPNFWLGMMLTLIFSIYLKLLPASGSYGLKYMILPSITLGTISAASIMRITRSTMLEVIRQDYIKTARAKGQMEFIVIGRHALKNAIIPIITVIGVQFGLLLGGSVLVESVFSIPGVGKYLIDAIKSRDYPVVQGTVLFLAIIFSFVNLFIDILYTYIDPRLRVQYQTSRNSKEVVDNGK